MDLAKLKTEIAKAEYVGMNDVQVAVALAVVNRQVDRATLDSGLLVASIVRAEFAALTAADKQYVQLVVMAPTMLITTTLKTELQAVFGPATATRANLIAMLKRPGTKWEEIGLGEQPTPSHVADARRPL